MSQSMEPPSYEEISQQPPALRIEVSNPPAYTSSLPSTPPPAYGDAGNTLGGDSLYSSGQHSGGGFMVWACSGSHDLSSF